MAKSNRCEPRRPRLGREPDERFSSTLSPKREIGLFRLSLEPATPNVRGRRPPLPKRRLRSLRAVRRDYRRRLSKSTASLRDGIVGESCTALHPRVPLARCRANSWGRAGLTRFAPHFFIGANFRFWSFSRVETSGGIRANLAGRYASALFDLARDESRSIPWAAASIC